MAYIAGIDLGSTSLKAVIYDEQGNIVASASRPTEQHHPSKEHPEWTVWLPEQIWGGTADAIKDAVAKLDDPGKIRGLAVTGMGMDAVPIDEKGDWLYPFISWHDPRTVPQQQWWLKNIGAEKTFSVSGFQVWGFNTALRLLWMQEHEPEILQRTHKWLLIEDFLNYMLCGQCATDYSMASCTLLFDQHTRAYSDEILRLSGIDRRLLADPKPSGTLLGGVHAKAAQRTGLAEGTPVVLGGHDFLCGALAGGAYRPGVVQDVVGTWEIAVAAVEQANLTNDLLNTGLMVDSHVARGMYAAWGAAVSADMLEWFRKEYGYEEKQKAQAAGGVDWDHLVAAAGGSPPLSRGCMFLPHLSGGCIPTVDPKSMGAFIGLRNATTKGDMLRAMLEGLSYQFLDICNALENSLGAKADTIVAVGGAVRNELWMQNKADVLGRRILVPQLEEGTPLGAAILAGIGTGLYANEHEAYEKTYKPGKVFQPDDKMAPRYAEGYKIWKDIYPALKGINERIFELG